MKIGFIGVGNMGGAIARAVAKSVNGANLYLTDYCMEKAQELAGQLSANAVDQEMVLQVCDYAFLGVKPQVLPGVLESIFGGVQKRQGSLTLISMAAGIATKKILQLLPHGTPLIRIMPNTPVGVGAGMVLYTCTDLVSETAKGDFLSMMAQAGRLDEIPENLIDAASAVSGCGPAFVCLFAEALADGGVACGLPRQKAALYAAQTLLGTAALLLESGQNPGTLKDAVCSPGGTTIQGVRALEEGGFRGAAMEAVIAAYEKTVALG